LQRNGLLAIIARLNGLGKIAHRKEDIYIMRPILKTQISRVNQHTDCMGSFNCCSAREPIFCLNCMDDIAKILSEARVIRF